MPEDKGLPKSPRAEREEKILQFWKENKIFDETLRKDSPKGEFVFYEGPPTANGRPGIHHVEARSFKDAIPRYKTMRGFHIPRKAGWDTHGLPVELEVEKKLGLKSKKEIEAYGIAKFNDECKKSLWTYVDEWRDFTDRVGYWVDLDHPYVIYHNRYMETVWGILKHVEKRDLLYKDYKVLPWCPRCGTGLSSHELAQPGAYVDVKDLSVYAKFKIVGFDKAYFLAWTTTPWTLPGNVALAVGEDMVYVEIKVCDEILVLAKERLSIITEEYEVVAEHKGSEMVGMEYEPLYPFLKDNLPESEKQKLSKAFKVYTADFVTTEDGTGIVHTAVMYGQEDFELGSSIGLPKYHLVDDSGHFSSVVGFLSGKFVKDEETAVDIIKDLAHRGLLYKKEKHEHSYPHCWRCKTPLIYYARDSWYIRMSALRDELVKENEKINWEPDYIKEGRFGDWLSEVKDWAISRERYWGTPMPIWESKDGKRLVIGSIDELKDKVKSSGNTYFVMRHGQAHNNVNRIVSTKVDVMHGLSDLGRTQAEETAKKLSKEKIDLIIASPFCRTKETAEIVAENIGIDKDKIIYDERLEEFNGGKFDGKSEDDLRVFLNSHDMFKEPLPGGESFLDVKKRVGTALDEYEKNYKGKKILIVTHKTCGWLLVGAAKRLNASETQALSVYMKNGEVFKLEPHFLPHNENFDLDLHKPYIDEVEIEHDGETYKRVKEVMDVWFDSGSVPFAQDPDNVRYPADFISEAIDQTRGWFYTMHAIGVLMEKGRAYKNVICLGLILDKDGKKMSKSVGNVVNPWEMFNKYGADVLRLWMYSVNQPGDAKNFDERSVDEIQKRIFNLLDNVYAFYELFRDESVENNEPLDLTNPLDQWIMARQAELIRGMENSLDDYKLLEPVRSVREFIDDLSTWYVRRSRDRIKDGDKNAKRVLYAVLKNISLVLAPFAPFAAEELYQKLRKGEEPTSVHLCNWPDAEKIDNEQKVLEEMQEVRRLVTLALEARSKANLKIRQPLSDLKVKTDLPDDLLGIIRDELNVKNVSVDKNLIEDVSLNTVLTPELVEEGRVRELIRSIQDERKEKGLKPSDIMEYSVPDTEKELFTKYGDDIKKTTNIVVKG
jgi:isoleucyl-tRNA synthetase